LLAATVPQPGDLREAAIAWLRANPRRSGATSSRAHPTAIVPAGDRAADSGCRFGSRESHSRRSRSRSLYNPPTTAAAAVVDAVEVGLRDGWVARVLTPKSAVGRVGSSQ
jgi:hypothetical protein